MTGEQIRAARALLRWKAADLAKASGVSVPTIQRIDSATGEVAGRYETIEAIRKALESQGIQFLDTGEAALGAGVALKVQGES